MSDTPRTCCVMVSTTVSRVMGKRLCQFAPHYEIDGKFYCSKHEINGKYARLKRTNAELLEAMQEINRDAWQDDKSRLRIIARRSDAAIAMALGK